MSLLFVELPSLGFLHLKWELLGLGSKHDEWRVEHSMGSSSSYLAPLSLIVLGRIRSLFQGVQARIDRSRRSNSLAERSGLELLSLVALGLLAGRRTHSAPALAHLAHPSKEASPLVQHQRHVMDMHMTLDFSRPFGGESHFVFFRLQVTHAAVLALNVGLVDGASVDEGLDFC
jgi:hypothetical protein